MDINASTLNAVFTGLSTAYNMRFEATETHYKKYSMIVGSTTSGNQYPRLDDLPGFREWIGDRIAHDLSAQNYFVENKEFEKTIQIKRSIIEDDQLGLFSTVASQFGQDAASLPDQLSFPLYKKGHQLKCYDGQNFFDTDHPGYNEEGGETSVSNYQAGANPGWYLIDDSQAVKPFLFQDRKKFVLTAMDNATDANVWQKGMFEYGVDGRCAVGFGLWQLAYKSNAPLTVENYKLARAAMGEIRRRDGQVININPRKLVVPSVLESEGRKILNAEMVDGGDSNIWKGTAELDVIAGLG